jgi:4-diphosphocytidyl-2-C-methyl-D-erythritol kinase
VSSTAEAPGFAEAIAPAKINPWLEVLGRRPDGYHEIETWMIAIDLCDRVTARVDASGAIRFSISGAFASADIPCDESNLCWRAAAEVLELVKSRDASIGANADVEIAKSDTAPASSRRALGLELHLVKNIPSQAGLGGASADAAATWIAAAKALGIDARTPAASAALARLGSDCVFFLEAASTGSAWCEGRGERVTIGPRVNANWFVAILTPEVRSPTRSVYAAFRKHLRGSREPHTLPPSWFEMTASAVRPFFFNELEAAALAAIPALAPWRATLDSCGAEHFRLSGSGSSFYGLFDDRDEAQSTLDRILFAARVRGLCERGSWIVRPTGFGARLASRELSEDR